MPAAARYAIARGRARLRRLAREPDAVLLLGREGRWRWPWAVLGALLTGAVLLALLWPVSLLDDLVRSRNWLPGGFPSDTFPLDPARPLTLLDTLLTVTPFLLAPLIVLRVVHGVPWRRAFSWDRAFEWRQFWRAALALLLVVALGVAYDLYWTPQHFRLLPRGADYVLWLVLALGLIYLQSLGEEVIVKGYLLRTWGAVLPFRLPVTAAVMALFISGHLANDDVRRDLLLNVMFFVATETVSYAMLYRTRNLAASAGMHWMNNAWAMLVATVPGQPTAMALVVYTDPVYAAGGSRLFDPVVHVTAAAQLAALFVLLLWRRSPFYLRAAPAAGPPADRDTRPEPTVADS